jgi:hypothetical protein
MFNQQLKNMLKKELKFLKIFVKHLDVFNQVSYFLLLFKLTYKKIKYYILNDIYIQYSEILHKIFQNFTKSIQNYFPK